MDTEGKVDWSFWPKHFEKVNKLDEISLETLLDVLKRYREAGKREIWVKHKHYGTEGKIKNFVISPNGQLEYLAVTRKDGAFAAWGAEHCKLTNRPKKKIKKKVVKPKTKIKVKTKVKKQPSPPCPEHKAYTGKRKPRSGCKNCLAYYESNLAKKKK